VTGRLVYKEWQGKDGAKRAKHSVVGRVSFGGRPATGEE
jgi:single-stranded DNA-binding protein